MILQDYKTMDRTNLAKHDRVFKRELVVSLESNIFTGGLTSMLGGFKAFIGITDNKKLGFSTVQGLRIENTDFKDFSSVVIPAPIGVRTSYVELISAINDILADLNSINYGVKDMERFSAYIKDLTGGRKVDIPVEGNRLEAINDDVSDLLAKHLDQRANLGEVTVGDVFSSSAEVADVVNQVRVIGNGMEDIEKLSKIGEEINYSIDKLNKHIDQKGLDLSDKATTYIGKQLSLFAHFTTHVFKLSYLSKTVSDLIPVIVDVIDSHKVSNEATLISSYAANVKISRLEASITRDISVKDIQKLGRSTSDFMLGVRADTDVEMIPLFNGVSPAEFERACNSLKDTKVPPINKSALADLEKINGMLVGLIERIDMIGSGVPEFPVDDVDFDEIKTVDAASNWTSDLVTKYVTEAAKLNNGPMKVIRESKTFFDAVESIVASKEVAKKGSIEADIFNVSLEARVIYTFIKVRMQEIIKPILSLGYRID